VIGRQTKGEGRLERLKSALLIALIFRVRQHKYVRSLHLHNECYLCTAQNKFNSYRNR